ncbi:sensor domain-containing diguanylate cyclase [Duganella aceris]|jgi:diguanylate cyclase (GGDEF)-like protein|uniref:Diguanylate cyclase n=1 Tax=Duganella aceris TaxID=2703883 RepID=A0ABX0FNP4_9BURK|nr:diguanylate cyclase [Duganella aceris]NGZ86247.1 diguanylate cyclase [Duganella aceris]
MRPLLGLLLSFKFKITALVIALVLVSGIGTGGISLLIAESELRHVIARQELSLLNSAAALIDNDLQHKRQLLRALTEQPPGQQLGLGQLQELLEAHETLRDEFFNVNAFDTAGNLVASLRDKNAKRINVAERTYFQQTLATREGLISAPFKSALSGRPVVVLTQPLRDAGGNVIGIILGAIDLQRPSFSDQLDALRTSADGYLFMVTDDGTVIHHPNKSLILSKIDDGAGTLGEAALKGGEGWQDDLLDDGVPTLLVHKHLRLVDWTIGLSYPVRSAFAPMQSVRLRAFIGAAVLTLLAGVFGWVVTAKLLRPLGKLRQHVENLSAGSADIGVFDVTRADEFGHLSRAFFALSQRRAQAELELHQLATTDVLTGINNRRMFDDFFPKALARAARSGQQVGLAFLDIDHFKQINDTLGHAAGDAVLREFARRLTAAVRCTDTVARLAGDEFVIVFEQLASGAEADLLGRKILDEMRAPFAAGEAQCTVTTSVGIAMTTNANVAMDDVMRAADQALYGVKAAGRNGFAVNRVGAERLLRVRGAN